METVGAYQAKTHLSELLERVAQGERFTITRNGQPVALLQPLSSENKPSVREAITELQTFRKGHHLGGITLREMIEEGRR